MPERKYLPLCDILFNIISLAAYFSDVVFDILMGYALFVCQAHAWFYATVAFVAASSISQQIVSLRWQSKRLHTTQLPSPAKQPYLWLIYAAHAAQCGVLWRYFKLFVPVDLSCVKHEVRDLCVLRLIHAFCQSMPLLLMQLYWFWNGDCSHQDGRFVELNKVCMSFSLFSVCWALASFSKNVRIRNVQRLVLTWLGVICQFLWRVGTVSARAISLIAYATLFKSWVFLVITLHWFTMLLWLLSPKNVFHGERLPYTRKALLYSLLAFVYTFAYVNLLENNHREKMVMFYVVMGLENAMLMFVWRIGVGGNAPWYSDVLPTAVFFLYTGGLSFMWLYYRYFHVRRLQYDSGGHFGNLRIGEKEAICDISFAEDYRHASPLSAYTHVKGENSFSGGEDGTPTTNRGSSIPGVFNCRFTNSYVAAMQKRKRKKPTSFIPPPSMGRENGKQDRGGVEREGDAARFDSVPFWRKPLPQSQYTQKDFYSDECGSPDGKRGNAVEGNLREIREEEESPRIARSEGDDSNYGMGKRMEAGPELLLTPRYLETNESAHSSSCYGEWNGRDDDAPYRLLREDGQRRCYATTRDDDAVLAATAAYKSYGPSDLESQMSLPRSYTLPREFKYYRGRRKAARGDGNFVASTNSSDGDVDSGDDSASTSSQTTQPPPMRLPARSTLKKHETRL